MISHRCKDCEWWDNRHPSIADIPIELGKKTPGFCRRRKAVSLQIKQHVYGAHPVMDADEFCGEFKRGE
jgi:hypothetical protein